MSWEQVTEYAEIINPESLAQWLATNDWTCAADGPAGQIWMPVDADGGKSGIMLPTNKSFVDFNRRFAEAVGALTAQFDWDLAKLAENVSSTNADLFFVRLEQSMYDGTIPFRQATQLLGNIDQMIKSAALAAYSPMHSGKGKIPGVVSEFLNEDVRMGHTKRGSFIITVAARHDHLEEPVSASRQRQPKAAPGRSPEDINATFTRRVMTTLSQTLDATRRHIDKGSDFLDLDEAVSIGLRLPLVEALSDMGSTDGVRGLDMSFDWAHSQPTPQGVPSHIEFNPQTFDELNTVSDRLRRKFAPQEETLVGPVTELRRGERPDTEHEAGEVVIRADVDGRLRNVRVELSGKDYDWAIRAHQSRLPFTVTGTLGRKGNSWALTGHIRVDTSFLQHRFGTHDAPK